MLKPLVGKEENPTSLGPFPSFWFAHKPPMDAEKAAVTASLIARGMASSLRVGLGRRIQSKPTVLC
jgi:hypothetical protein